MNSTLCFPTFFPQVEIKQPRFFQSVIDRLLFLLSVCWLLHSFIDMKLFLFSFVEVSIALLHLHVDPLYRSLFWSCLVSFFSSDVKCESSSFGDVLLASRVFSSSVSCSAVWRTLVREYVCVGYSYRCGFSIGVN